MPRVSNDLTRFFVIQERAQEQVIKEPRSVILK